MPTPFDPLQHLTRVQGGNDYLEVKWRVVWLRLDHPEAVIDTELINADNCDEEFIVRANVLITRDVNGVPTQVEASGHASEPRVNPNRRVGTALENCETSAIGRALGNLGYSEDMALALFGRPADGVVREEPARQQNAARGQARKPANGTARRDAPPLPADPVVAMCHRIGAAQSVDALRRLRREIEADPELNIEVVQNTFNDRFAQLRPEGQGLPG